MSHTVNCVSSGAILSSGELLYYSDNNQSARKGPSACMYIHIRAHANVCVCIQTHSTQFNKLNTFGKFPSEVHGPIWNLHPDMLNEGQFFCSWKLTPSVGNVQYNYSEMKKSLSDFMTSTTEI